MGKFRHIISICLVLFILFCLAISAHAINTPNVRLDDTRKEVISLSERSLTEILEQYLKIVREVQNEVKDSETEYSLTGALHDQNQDGIPELFLLYVSETNSQFTSGWYAAIAVPIEGKQIQCLKYVLGDVVGGECGIYGGCIDKKPVIHCIYTYCAMGSPTHFGWDDIFNFSSEGLENTKSLYWYENTESMESEYFVDGVENEEGWQTIINGIEEELLIDLPTKDIEELKYQIVNYPA